MQCNSCWVGLQWSLAARHHLRLHLQLARINSRYQHSTADSANTNRKQNTQFYAVVWSQYNQSKMRGQLQVVLSNIHEHNDTEDQSKGEGLRAVEQVMQINRQCGGVTTVSTYCDQYTDQQCCYGY